MELRLKLKSEIVEYENIDVGDIYYDCGTASGIKVLCKHDITKSVFTISNGEPKIFTEGFNMWELIKKNDSKSEGITKELTEKVLQYYAEYTFGDNPMCKRLKDNFGKDFILDTFGSDEIEINGVKYVKK